MAPLALMKSGINQWMLNVIGVFIQLTMNICLHRKVYQRLVWLKPSLDCHDGLRRDATRRLVGSSRCGADTSTTTARAFSVGS